MRQEGSIHRSSGSLDLFTVDVISSRVPLHGYVCRKGRLLERREDRRDHALDLQVGLGTAVVFGIAGLGVVRRDISAQCWMTPLKEIF